MVSAVIIRDAGPDDWPAIWPFLHDIVAAGDTFSWAPDTSEEQARSMWLHERPGRTFVAVDDDGTVLGTAESHPNQPAGGPAAHVANAGFMVNARHGGRGVGRALAEHTVAEARNDGFRAMQFNAVAASNTHAVRLWQSLGFEIVATIPEGFRHPTQGYVGLHVMYRPL
jgi:ribosomal protein S18 acetylase RimI-like enzyme